MIDLVKPLKMETPGEGGTEDDLFPTEVNEAEDYILSKGIAIEDDTTTIDKDLAGNIVLKDAVSGPKTLAQLIAGTGMTPADHLVLDQLVHNISENSFIEYTRSSGLISGIIIWANSSKLTKIREESYVRTGNLVSSYTIKQYDGGGILIKTETHTISRSGGLIVSEEVTVA